MRRLIFNRYVVWVWLLLAAYWWFAGTTDAAKGGLVIAAFVWLIAGFPRLLRLPRRNRNERLVRNAVRSPWGKVEADLGGCFARLDPTLRQWLRSDTNVRTKGNRHVQ